MSEREGYSEIADTLVPKAARRKTGRHAPGEDIPISKDPQRQNQKYGKPTSFRLSEEFRQMLAAVKQKYNVEPRELVQLAVSQYVQALETGKATLPIDEDASKRRLVLPDVPRVRG